MTEHDESQFDEHLKDLFAPVRPRDDFEESLLAKLRERPAKRFVLSHWRIHPAVRTSAAAIAASLLVGTVGYFANERLLRPDDRAHAIANDLNPMRMFRSTLRTDTPASNLVPSGEKWDFGGGRNSQAGWSNSGTRTVEAEGHFDPLLWTFANKNTGVDGQIWSPTTRQSRTGNSNNHDQDGQNIIYSDGHVTFDQNPFAGIGRDNVYKQGSATPTWGTGAVNTDPFVGKDRGLASDLDGDGDGDAAKPAPPEREFRNTRSDRDIGGSGENAREESDKTLRNRTTSIEREKKATVGNLIALARQYTEQGKYQDALGVIDHILVIDPSNDYAMGARPLLEDRKLTTAYSKNHEQLSKAFDKTDEPEAAKIPHTEILRYPENWPATSEQREKSVAVGHGGTDADQQAAEQLDRVLPEINFNAVPFSEVVDFLRDKTQANLYVNWRALESAGIDRNTPVTARLKGVKFSKVLGSVLDEVSGAGGVKLSHTIDEGVISVSTAEDLSHNTVTRVYDIRDLALNVPDFTDAPEFNLSGGGGGGGADQKASPTTQPSRADVVDQLVKTISETVAPESWANNGGSSGSVRELAGQLIVTQTPENQRAVARLVEQLRESHTKKADDGQPASPATQPASPASDQPAATEGRAIIRTGTIELSVDSFDATFSQIKKIVDEMHGYVGTINSEKLPNGKVRGTMTLRVPPDKTDALVSALRPLGEVTRQNLAAEEVTKQIVDLTRQLDTANTMHQRLSDLGTSTTGPVKDKVAAEREAGEWRQKAEAAQSQIASLKNQVNLATITVVLAEKGLDSPASIRESETMDLGMETEDVEKSRADASKAIADAQGRIMQSQLKQFDAGQVTAQIRAEVSPERAAVVVDRLKQIGKVTRLDVQRQTSGQKFQPSTRIDRDNTQLVISLYNLANVQPRIATTLNIAVDDVEKAYAAMLERAQKSGARILSSNVNRQQEGGGASLQFEMKSDLADAALSDLRAMGEVMRLDSVQAGDTNSTTAAKRAFVMQITSIATAQPRQVTTRSIASADLSKSYNAILEAAKKAGARLVVNKIEQTSPESTAGYLDFEVRRASAPAIDVAIASAGDVVGGNIIVSSDVQNTLESKVQYKLSISPANQLSPREMSALGIETRDVEQARAALSKIATDAGGRVLDSNVSKEMSGRTISRVLVDVPLARAAEVSDAAQTLGTVRVSQSSQNAQAPAGNLARARLDITFATPDAIVQADAGVFATVKSALTTSAAGLMWSLRLIVIGVCLIAPWAFVSVGAIKLYRRSRARAALTPK